jgi:4-diphosphocytidyl-2-C-methyl-D-erythritol kinase
MGGGSSDAASTLLALNRLWGLNWPRQRLLEIGLALGADVPFFVGGRNAFVEGIGERLTPLALPRQWFAVVKPEASLPTAAIFGHPALRRDTEAVILAGFLDGDTGASALASGLATGFGRNDLQPPAEDRCPEVAQAARWLEARFGNGRMTGSGSAVFARAGTGDQPVATFPAESLPPGWVGRMCRGLERHPLAEWAPD